jgi:hypothetical protein
MCSQTLVKQPNESKTFKELLSVGFCAKNRCTSRRGSVRMALQDMLLTCKVLHCCYCCCRCLRAFRALLFAEDAALPGAACLKDLPASLVLHHCFSRCGRHTCLRVQTLFACSS